MKKINTQFHNVNVPTNNKNTKKKNNKAKQKKILQDVSFG